MRGLNKAHDIVEDWLSTAEFDEPLEAIASHVEWCLFQTIHAALQNLTHSRKTDIDFDAFASRFNDHKAFRIVDG